MVMIAFEIALRLSWLLPAFALGPDGNVDLYLRGLFP